MTDFLQVQYKDRIFFCENCGQAIQGWNAAHWWVNCCPDKKLREATDAEYRERYPWLEVT